MIRPDRIYSDYCLHTIFIGELWFVNEHVEFDPLTSMPKRIEYFTIIELLGQGAMGYVFRAHDNDLKIDVALKVIKPEVATNEMARE